MIILRFTYIVALTITTILFFGRWCWELNQVTAVCQALRLTFVYSFSVARCAFFSLRQQSILISHRQIHMSVPLTFYQYHYMDYCSFIVNPKIKLYKPSSFVLFSVQFWLILFPFTFIQFLRTIVSIYIKVLIWSLFEIMLNLQIDLNKIEILNSIVLEVWLDARVLAWHVLNTGFGSRRGREVLNNTGSFNSVTLHVSIYSSFYIFLLVVLHSFMIYKYLHIFHVLMQV